MMTFKLKLSSKLLGSDLSKGSAFGSHRSSGSGEGLSSHLNFRCILITFCLAAIIYEVFWVVSVLVGWISASDPIMTTDSFMMGHSEKKDLTNITWAHAVNSQEELNKALKGPAMILEADIIMAVGDSGKLVPIMAHPPATTSDLSFSDFLSAVLKHNSEKENQKGIKLDFKQIDSVEPVLEKLEHKLGKWKKAEFPIYLNADILPGPVNSTVVPVDGKEFLSLAKPHLTQHPHIILSLGWTTRFGSDDEKLGVKNAAKILRGQYTKEQMDAMVNLWRDADLNDTTVTFPVRVAIASQSVDTLHNFLSLIGPKSSLTLWSNKDDFINRTRINNLISVIGKDKVYCDLPFPLTPKVDPVPDSPVTPDINPQTDNDTNTDGDNPGANDGNTPNGMKCLAIFTVTLFLAFYFF